MSARTWCACTSSLHVGRASRHGVHPAIRAVLNDRCMQTFLVLTVQMRWTNVWRRSGTDTAVS